nr:hypothetical protein B0A51_12828 [Rachicladosporium sp. CCFEE 5018]
MEAKEGNDGSAATDSLEQRRDEDMEADDQDEVFNSKTMQDSLTAIDRQYAAQPDVPRRVHILGTGSIGKLVAHSLRGLPNPPPVTLLLHRKMLLRAWEAGKQEITMLDDGVEVKRSGFDVELMPLTRREHGVDLKDGQSSVYDFDTEAKPHEIAKQLATEQSQNSGEQSQQPTDALFADDLEPPDTLAAEPIHNLIVTLKAPTTLSALRRLRPRLLPTSTICLLQNGMGVIDTLNTHLFPDPTQRPNYMQGIITHGVNVPPAKARVDPFYAVHAGHGTIALGLLPRDDLTPGTPRGAAKGEPENPDIWAPSSRYLLRSLTRAPVLCAVGFTPLELLQQQLEKLAVNSVLNPLTVLLDARNGSILYNFALTRTMRLLLAETSLILRSLPELRNLPNINARFSAARLETLVVSVANLTSDNISSMLADVRAGRQTEVEFINGYIVRRGEELGIKAVVNYAIMQVVLGKGMIGQRERREDVTFEKGMDPNAADL